MTITRRKFLQTSAAAALSVALWRESSGASQGETQPQGGRNAPGEKFQPSWDSLKQYECPEWFRDAKFGIWAHWSPQCVPEQGDWYAHRMYIEGSDHYDYHVKHYGHPSKVGFKEIDHLWKAEKWDPEKLIALYKAAGAKYFVALANHHDNFDCYDSKYQPWNSVAIGPKKDLVGEWAKEARTAGLHFGVTCHAARTWSWMETAQGADTHGSLAGVPYDGKLTKADGKGQWWEGLDPQDLYAQNHPPMDGGDRPTQAYCEKFYNRTVDLIDKYHPDLLYFDDGTLPLYDVDPTIGLRIAAHHYNTSIKTNGGKLQAILNGKGLRDEYQQCMIQDYERGQSDSIRPHPWQTDTCIGDWHYRRSIYENHQYKTPDLVVKMLVDIVSKNGNLLLNIPMRGDGSIDPDEMAFLEGITAWNNVNGEGIFGTRPWKLYGEGAVKVGDGGFNEGARPYTSRDFRFTTKGNALYAFAMNWPDDGLLTVRTLASSSPGLVGKIKRVSLLGSKEKLSWKQTADGLVVTLPAQKPCDHAYTLKIEGLDLAASLPTPPPPDPVQAAADGSYTLIPSDAVMSGATRAQGGGVPNIGYWNNPQDTVKWGVHFDKAGTYSVTTKTAAADGPTAFVLDAGAGASPAFAVIGTSNWDTYNEVSGVLKIDSAGDHAVTVRPADPATWKPMNLAALTLTRTGD